MSARDKEFDRIIGLEKGSDDYITKPFSPKELVLRVNNIIRRTYKDENQRVEVDGYEIDENQRMVFHGDEQIELTTKEFELLMLFVNNKGTAFPRDEILSKVWDTNYYGSDRVVDDTMRRLRKKMPELDTDSDEKAQSLAAGTFIDPAAYGDYLSVSGDLFNSACDLSFADAGLSVSDRNVSSAAYFAGQYYQIH